MICRILYTTQYSSAASASTTTFQQFLQYNSLYSSLNITLYCIAASSESSATEAYTVTPLNYCLYNSLFFLSSPTANPTALQQQQSLHHSLYICSSFYINQPPKTLVPSTGSLCVTACTVSLLASKKTLTHSPPHLPLQHSQQKPLNQPLQYRLLHHLLPNIFKLLSSTSASMIAPYCSLYSTEYCSLCCSLDNSL